MDETNKAPQDAKTSASSAGSTSEQPRTYTEDEYQKALSDALAKAGRTAKDIEGRETAVKAKEEAIAQKEKEIHQTNWEIDLFNVAHESGITPEELKETCKELNITTIEQAKTLAQRLTRKGQTGKPDSLVTHGAKPSPSSLTADQKLERGFADLKKK